MKQEEALSGNSHSVKVSNEPSPVQKKEEDKSFTEFQTQNGDTKYVLVIQMKVKHLFLCLTFDF